jgi:uncharacterized RDD family membrane protein YckC
MRAADNIAGLNGSCSMAEATTWFYQQGAQPVGPISTAELCQKFSSGELPLETLVYSDSIAGWTPAEKIRGFRDAVPEASAAAPTSNEQAQSPTPAGVDPVAPGTLPGCPTTLPCGVVVSDPPRPWVRFFARSIDGMIGFGSLVALCFVICPPQITAQLSYPMLAVGFYFSWVLIETFMLWGFGTTPGKSLLGVRITNAAGRSPTLREALKRTFLMFVQGQGLGLPVISFITHIVSYGQLTRDGQTNWDRANHLNVRHSPCGFARIVSGLGVASGFYLAAIALAVMVGTLRSPTSAAPKLTATAPLPPMFPGFNHLGSATAAPVPKRSDPRVAKVTGTWVAQSTKKAGIDVLVVRNVLTLNSDGTFQQSIRATDSAGKVRSDLGHRWSGVWEFEGNAIVQTVLISSTRDYPIGRWTYEMVNIGTDEISLCRTSEPEGFIYAGRKPVLKYQRVAVTVRQD